MVKALILVAMLAGCGSTGDSPLPSNPRSIWCTHNFPRRDARSDTLRTDLDEINRHNAQGVAWCGWKP
ncbi:hypothetical protein [Mesorhizobium sp. 1M-11]|uniref:hypothetical protein n=1 Tax=Mesorhizobium sp. 1M-11 TaxID=1529006 RepID=UPI0006C76CB2|nr:hypothetical protein [Mesorhizobium sp. 1M-11]